MASNFRKVSGLSPKLYEEKYVIEGVFRVNFTIFFFLHYSCFIENTLIIKEELQPTSLINLTQPTLPRLTAQ